MPKSTFRIAFTTLLVAGLVAGAIGLAAVVSGLLNVSAVPPHSAVSTFVLHHAFKRSVARHSADTTPPDDLDSPSRIALGARHYANECAKCHGGPGLGQDPIALSMRPRPQHLPEVVDQFDDAELHWIVMNGVRFSAMPSWPAQGRDDEAWSMVAFLRKLPDLSAEEYLGMVLPEAERDVPETPYGSDVVARAVQPPPMSGPTEEYGYTAPTTEFADFAMDGRPLVQCESCHGADGTGTPTHGAAPNLSIQSAEYLRESLNSFADGARHSGFMQSVASNLSHRQIDALSGHFAERPVPSGVPVDADLAELDLGRSIARDGLPDRNLPGCLTCHEGVEKAGAIEVPRLYGQSALYIESQLMAFDAGGRGATGIYNPMGAESHRLDATEMAAVAAYFASQPPLRDQSSAISEPVDPAAAETIAGNVCVECHMPDGRGAPDGEFPNLTLQTAPYIATQLRAFRMNDRHAAQMNVTADKLSDTQIAALAAYFGEMPAEAATAKLDPDAVERGGVIAREGLADRDVQACLACHGEGSTELIPLIARLNGQHQSYLERRLRYFAGPDGDEAGYSNPMPKIARALNEREHADVSAWFAAQEPLAKQ